jgi:hypothetical protein
MERHGRRESSTVATRRAISGTSRGPHWGGEQARGTGTSYWEPPDAGVAASVKEPATIVAYNLGNCNGQLMYQAAKWYFPGKREAFDPAGRYNICTGDYVKGN